MSANYKVALVTGATGGIGKAITSKLIAENIKVIITGRNKEKLDEITNSFGKENIIYSEIVDLRNKEEIIRFVDNIKERNINVDILVNNAGNAFGLSSFQEYDIDDMMDMIDLNVKSLILMSRFIVEDMVKNNNGIIINVGSIAGDYAYANASVYCASKAAVKTLSDGMRVDLVKTDVKVCTIIPGIVETDFSLVRFKGDKEKADLVYSGIDCVQADDIANAVWFMIDQPLRVQISEISVVANQQGNNYTKHTK